MSSRKIKRKSFIKNKLKRFFSFVFLFFSLFLIFFFIWASYLVLSLPDINVSYSQSTKIYDRTGNYLIYEIGPKRTILEPKEIPEIVKKAVVAAEDKDFYSHIGVSFTGILRSIYLNLKSQQLAYGGSTITQQLVRNLFLSHKRNFIRKIKEIILAIILERKYSKEEILAAYLNTVNFGEGRYGIESASEFYFSKKPKDLTLAEAALLVAIPKAPAIYSPLKNKQLAKERRNYVLKRMYEDGYINKDEYEKAINEPIELKIQTKKIQAIHFALEVKKILETMFPDLNLEKAGLKVITTLDYDLQKKAEELALKYSEINNQIYNAKNIALGAVDPETGEVLVMVGSKNYFDESVDGAVNILYRPRQIGSAIKPFIYSVFFEKGYPDETILFDVPTNFSLNPYKSYTPQNWDETFRGPISVRQSLAQSINVTSVKVLYLAGYNDVIKKLQELEISTLDPKKDYGLSLGLGVLETKMIEMLRAYSSLANGGNLPTLSLIKEIYDYKNDLIYKYTPQTKKVFDENITNIINDILSDDSARIGVFSPGSKLNIPGFKVAAKTGTTQKSRDAWVFGYTPYLVVGVWAGNNDETPMKGMASGYYTAVPYWNEFLTYALNRKDFVTLADMKTFKKPIIKKIDKMMLNGEWQKIEIKPFDKLTKLPTNDISRAEFKEAVIIHSILYYVDKNNPLGPPPLNPMNDPQFINWEKGVLDWILTHQSIFELPIWIDPLISKVLSQN